MEKIAMDRGAPASPAPSGVMTANAAENREVVRAVKALNGTEMFGQENQLTFGRDPDTKKMVIRVVNRKTNELISQIPPEYVLRLARDLAPKVKSGG